MEIGSEPSQVVLMVRPILYSKLCFAVTVISEVDLGSQQRLTRDFVDFYNDHLERALTNLEATLTQRQHIQQQQLNEKPVPMSDYVYLMTKNDLTQIELLYAAVYARRIVQIGQQAADEK